MKFKHLHNSLKTFERDARIFAVQTRHEPSNSVKKAKQWLLENHSEAMELYSDGRHNPLGPRGLWLVGSLSPLVKNCTLSGDAG